MTSERKAKGNVWTDRFFVAIDCDGRSVHGPFHDKEEMDRVLEGYDLKGWEYERGVTPEEAKKHEEFVRSEVKRAEAVRKAWPDGVEIKIKI